MNIIFVGAICYCLAGPFSNLLVVCAADCLAKAQMTSTVVSLDSATNYDRNVVVAELEASPAVRLVYVVDDEVQDPGSH